MGRGGCDRQCDVQPGFVVCSSSGRSGAFLPSAFTLLIGFLACSVVVVAARRVQVALEGNYDASHRIERRDYSSTVIGFPVDIDLSFADDRVPVQETKIPKNLTKMLTLLIDEDKHYGDNTARKKN